MIMTPTCGDGLESGRYRTAFTPPPRGIYSGWLCADAGAAAMLKSSATSRRVAENLAVLCIIPLPLLVGAEDRCSRIGNHSEAIHALIRRIDSIRKDARLVTAKAESGPLEIREPLRPWAPALYPTAPVRRIADYARVRIQPLRVLLRPKPMLSAHLFNFANRSSGTRLAGVTGT